jgi:hypothetical protein
MSTHPTPDPSPAGVGIIVGGAREQAAAAARAREIEPETKALPTPLKSVIARPSRQGRRAAPVAAPLRLREFAKDFFETNTLGPNTNSVFLYSINYCYLVMRSQNQFPEEIPEIKSDDFSETLDSEQKAWVAAVNDDKACWVEYTYDLVACFQVKDLRIDNIISYFAATGSTYTPNNSVTSLLRWMAHSIGSLDIYGLRGDMTSWNPFIDYHTRAFSSASLLIRFQQSFPSVTNEIFPDVDWYEVKEIDRNSWDLSQSYRLPQTLLGIVSIWVTHSGIIRPPNRWFQGEKARGVLTVKEATMWERFFRYEERAGLPAFADNDSVEVMTQKMVTAGFKKGGVVISN